MKLSRVRRPLRLRMIFALSIAAMATQVGGASAAPAPAVAGEPSVEHRSAAVIPLPDKRTLLRSLESVLRGPSLSGDWELLLAGLAGVCAIARRRTTAITSLSLDPYSLRRR